MIDLQCDSDEMWTAEICLPEWAGFQSRRGYYGSKDQDAVSDGSVRVGLAPDSRIDGPITSKELAMVRWFEVHHAEQGAALLSALFDAFPTLRTHYLDAWELDEDDTTFPVIKTPAELRKLIGLHDVHIHSLENGGMPYIGYEFGCDWDDEHGLGVLMHGNRAVEIGGADCTFTHWIAKRDATTPA